MDFDMFLAEMLLKKQAIKRRFTMLGFCTTCQNGETRKSHFHSIGLCYTHNAPVHCVPERKIVICDVFDSV